MREMKEIVSIIAGVRSCIEQLKVSGRGDCAIIIASCNTLDDIAAELGKGESAE